VPDLPHFLFDEAFTAGQFSGFISASRSFKEVTGIVTNGDTTVQFETDLNVDDARAVLESLGPFDPSRHPVPVTMPVSAETIAHRE